MKNKIFLAIGALLFVTALSFNNCSGFNAGQTVSAENGTSSSVGAGICTPPQGFQVACNTIDTAVPANLLQNSVAVPDMAQIDGFTYGLQPCSSLLNEGAAYVGELQVSCSQGTWVCSNSCVKQQAGAVSAPCAPPVNGIVECTTSGPSGALSDMVAAPSTTQPDGTVIGPTACNSGMINLGGQYQAGQTYHLRCVSGTWTCPNNCSKPVPAPTVTPTPSATPAPNPGGGSGGGGVEGCFIAGTQVLLADGSTKVIEDIRIDDLVLIRDEETGVNNPSRVKAVYHHSPQLQRLHRFILSDGGSLVSNQIHPIFVVEKGAYFKAEQIYAFYLLRDKLSLLKVDGTPVSIQAIELEEKEVSVYNFEVEGINQLSESLGAYGLGHNYFAGGYLVHNALYTKLPILALTVDFLGHVFVPPASALPKQKN